MEWARNISKDCNLPIYLWTETVSHANYLVNRSPTWANSSETPKHKFSSLKLDLSNLKIFGCLTYLHVPKVDRKKLDSKTTSYMFLGYDSQTKAYRLYDRTRRKVIVSRDVVFDETKIGYQFLKDPEANLRYFESPSVSKTPPTKIQQPASSEYTKLVNLDNTHPPVELADPPAVGIEQPKNPATNQTRSPVLQSPCIKSP